MNDRSGFISTSFSSPVNLYRLDAGPAGFHERHPGNVEAQLVIGQDGGRGRHRAQVAQVRHRRRAHVGPEGKVIVAPWFRRVAR